MSIPSLFLASFAATMQIFCRILFFFIPMLTVSLLYISVTFLYLRLSLLIDCFFPLSATQLSLHHWNHQLIFSHGFGLPWNFVPVVSCRSESIFSIKLLLDHFLLNLVLGCIAAADGSSILVPLLCGFEHFDYIPSIHICESLLIFTIHKTY